MSTACLPTPPAEMYLPLLLQLLMDDLHFYRYGNVDKLILNPPYANKKGVTYQAYVTYGNHLDSSLAIVVDML